MSVDVEFIYDCNNENKTKLNDLSVFICGFIRNIEKNSENISNIPKDIIMLISLFKGIKYNIHGIKPNDNEYDYVIQLLNPIKCLGFDAYFNRITGLYTMLTKNNILCFSKIIQINNEYINNINDFPDLMTKAKENSLSYFILRCNKSLNKYGTHYHFDLTSKNIHKTGAFPIGKFHANIMKKIFNKLHMEILGVYVTKKCYNGKFGLSILTFMEEDMYPNPNILISTIKNDIIKEINEDILDVIFVEKINNLKGNGINCGFSNIIKIEDWKSHRMSLRDCISQIMKGTINDWNKLKEFCQNFEFEYDKFLPYQLELKQMMQNVNSQQQLHHQQQQQHQTMIG